eukprot:3973958-Pleurochrysis_carterae.AAC.3
MFYSEQSRIRSVDAAVARRTKRNLSSATKRGERPSRWKGATHSAKGRLERAFGSEVSRQVHGVEGGSR